MRRIKSYEFLLDTHPLLRAVLPLCLGIIIGEFAFDALQAHTAHLIGLVALSVLACLAHLLVRKWHFSFISYNIALSLGFAALGALLLCCERGRLHPTSEPTPSVCRAVINSQPKRTKSTWQANAIMLDGNYRGKTVRLSLLDKDSTDRKTICTGDGILLSSPVRALPRRNNPGEFDFSTYLRRQNIAGEAFCFEKNWQRCNETLSKELRHRLPLLERLKIKALNARSGLVNEYTDHFEGSALAIVSAIALGDRTRIDAATRQLFSQTGASHLLALSGLHISILFAMYCLIVARISRKSATRKSLELMGVALLWGFAFLVGMPLSLVRAVIMFTVYQILDTFSKDKASINNLVLALLIILIASPMSLFDVGLQLSCLAVFSILIFTPLFPRPTWLSERPTANFFYELLIVTISAQIGTAPLVAYYFHNIPLIGLLSAFIVIPLSYPILIGGLLFLILPGIMQEWTAPILTFLLNAMQQTLDFFGRTPFSCLEVHPTLATTLLCYTGIALAIAYFHTRRLKFAALFCGILLTCAGIELYAHHPSRLRSQIVFYNLPGHPAIHCIASSKQTFLWTANGKADSTALRYVKETFWKERLDTEPIRIESKADHEIFYHHPPFIVFGGKTIAILNDALWEMPTDDMPQTDFLFVTRGVKGDAEKALKAFRPREIILDASLSKYQCDHYKTEAEHALIPCHDIATDGAFIFYLSEP